jgi:hypothetical protein
MSQMNKDEADKCLAISKSKHSSGDAEGALRFAKKSLKLCETDNGKAWV